MPRKFCTQSRCVLQLAVAVVVGLGLAACTKSPLPSAGSGVFSGTRAASPQPTEAPKLLAWQPRTVKFAASPSNGYELSDAEVDALVNAFTEIKNAFWLSSSGYRTLPNGQVLPAPVRVDQTDFEECLAASNFERWSTLMVHYFCHFPSSKRGVHPDIRSCLMRFGLANPTQSVTVNGAPLDRGASPFQTAYDICTYFPIDREGFTKDGAPLDWMGFSAIALPDLKPALEAKEPIGPFAWIHKHQEDVFKYLMFANKCSLSAISQWRVLQKVHGAGQYVDSTGCFAEPTSPPELTR